jgi:Leucine-rich repeat (LRR) protein
MVLSKNREYSEKNEIHITVNYLQILNLAETSLSSVPSGLFHALPVLKMLIIAGNQFTVIPEELQHAIHLEYLNLNNNPIKTLDAESFQGLSQLKHLNVSSMTSLERIDANTFTPLASMTQLWCSFNPVLKQIHPAAFSNMDESDGTLQLSEVCKSLTPHSFAFVYNNIH